MLVRWLHHHIAHKQSPTHERREIHKQAQKKDDTSTGSLEQPTTKPVEQSDTSNGIGSVRGSVRDQALKNVPSKETLTSDLHTEIETLKWIWSELSLDQRKQLLKLGISQQLLDSASAATIAKHLLSGAWDDISKSSQQSIEAIILAGNNPRKLTAALGGLKGAIKRRLTILQRANDLAQQRIDRTIIGKLQAKVKLGKLRECIADETQSAQSICETLGISYTTVQHIFQKLGQPLNRKNLLFWISSILSLGASLDFETDDAIQTQKIARDQLRLELQQYLRTEVDASIDWYEKQRGLLQNDKEPWNQYGLHDESLEQGKAANEAMLRRAMELCTQKPNQMNDGFEREIQRSMYELQQQRNGTLLSEQQERQQLCDTQLLHLSKEWFGTAGIAGIKTKLQTPQAEEQLVSLGIQTALIDDILEPYQGKTLATIDTIDPKKRIEAQQPHVLRNIHGLLFTLGNEHLLSAAVEHKRVVADQVIAKQTDTQLEQGIALQIESTRQQIDSTVGGILQTSAFTQPTICQRLGLHARLQNQQIELQREAEHCSAFALEGRWTEARASLSELQVGASQLQDVLSSLQHEPRIIEADLGSDRGYYDPTKHQIVINASLSDERKERTKLHEQNHFYFDALKNLWPNLALSRYQRIRIEVDNPEEWTLLEGEIAESAKHWNIDPKATPAQRSALIGEELMVYLDEYWSMVEEGVDREQLIDVFGKNDVMLFEKLSQYQDQLQIYTDDDTNLDTVAIGNSLGKRYATGNSDEEEDDESNNPNRDPNTTAARSQANEEPDPVPENIQVNRSKEYLELIRRVVQKANEFSSVYGHRSDFQDAKQRLAADYKTLIAEFENDPNPERNEPFATVLQETWELAGRFEDTMDKMMLETREGDVQNAAPVGKNFVRAFNDSVGWMSPLGIGKMLQEAWEDIQRMWERGSQSLRNELGYKLTDWIPDSVYIGGRLKHEFNRRQEESEVEEVNVWEKALQNKDAYQVQAMFRTARNKDQLKAMLINLTQKGRMDWNDRHFLRAMNDVSNYNMPIDQCLVDEQLRDSWLRKMTADIWQDNDEFYTWRKQNDDTFNSEKDKFKTKVDDLANVNGGMAGELRKQLMLYEQIQDGSVSEDMIDQVNPHFYFEVLHYAMRNGKMSMEQKFFYLVRGISSGLLSIDRLRWLSGDNGGILNRFPFIDFFYQENNTLPEMQTLARRLTETTPGADPYAPGPKTMYFLQLEVAKSQKAQERANKGALRAAGDIDHEDLPLLLSMASYSHINSFASESDGNAKTTIAGWQNAYVGYGTIFKSHSMLSKYDGQGSARLSDKDYSDLATRIAAYVHMDNWLTKNARDSENRPNVTMDEIMNQAGPSGGNTLVREFRHANNTFVKRLIERLQEIGAFDWNRVRRTKETQDIELSEYLNWDNQNGNRERRKQQIMHTLTENFQNELQQAMIQNPQIVKEVMQQSLTGPNALIEEPSSKFNDETIQEYISDRHALARPELTIEGGKNRSPMMAPPVLAT